MEKRLRNLSLLVSEYQVHAVDLVRFMCINPNKDLSDEILKKTFILIFRSIKGGKNFLPFHLFVYSKIIDAAKKAKETPTTYALSVKDLKTEICIEDFDPAELKEAELFSVLDKISPENRALLCLSVRHKINNDELASLFKISKGTVLSRIIKAKSTLSRSLIEVNKMTPKKSVKQPENKDCFFVKNNVSEKKKIEKHITKCAACKNFYNWQLKINKLLEDEPKPTITSSINKDIFEHLDFISIDRRIMYNVRTKLFARIAFIVIVSTVVLFAALWIKKQVGPHKNMVQEIKISSKIVQRNEETKYVLVTSIGTDWKGINKRIKDTLSTYGEFTNSSNEKGILYMIILNKAQAMKLVQEVQTQTNFDVRTLAEPVPLENKNNIRVEIQVNKNGV